PRVLAMAPSPSRTSFPLHDLRLRCSIQRMLFGGAPKRTRKARVLPNPQSMIAWTIYIAFAGAVLLLFLPRVFARWLALLTTVAVLAVSLITLFQTPIADLATFKTIVRVPWVPMLGMNYHLAVDGISLTM